ncbi:MAG: hypothetical protein H7Z13_10875 [Ferruginibacter sp.]|nr:hypothetical protein [Ferruginibacter sp.]
MQKKFYLSYSLFALFLLCSNVMLAQQPVKPVASPGAKYKKPLAKSWLGKVTGNISLNADEARQLITLPLKITDDKNVDYLISSYQFAYKRIGVTEDEATGKTSAQSDMAADRFTSTPLPAVWQKNIIEGLHKGEELYFFDIIVFDKQGRRFFAPELKITIQ